MSLTPFFVMEKDLCAQKETFQIDNKGFFLKLSNASANRKLMRLSTVMIWIKHRLFVTTFAFAEGISITVQRGNLLSREDKRTSSCGQAFLSRIHECEKLKKRVRSITLASTCRAGSATSCRCSGMSCSAALLQTLAEVLVHPLIVWSFARSSAWWQYRAHSTETRTALLKARLYVPQVLKEPSHLVSVKQGHWASDGYPTSLSSSVPFSFCLFTSIVLANNLTWRLM